MIKIFSKIRQNLLSEGNTGRYLKYAFGEIILVMVGILLALQVNNWNENRKQDIRRQEYYGQLLDDLHSDSIFIQSTIKDYSKYLKDYQAYTDSYYDGLLTPVQVYEQISKLPLISQPLTFNTSTIEALQNSGDIGLMPSDIRNRLIDLRRLQNITIKRFEDTDSGKNDLTQNISHLIGSTTFPARLVHQPEISGFLRIDKNLKEMILLYEGIHKWKSISHREAINNLQKIVRETDTLVDLIKKEQRNK